ncbi:MAG: hypothetical protein KGR26_06750, partial [Cyanobacteria bacterium REEB65]|nr:hypothetical protein [Cyanobacteria bacterium REEB65]
MRSSLSKAALGGWIASLLIATSAHAQSVGDTRTTTQDLGTRTLTSGRQVMTYHDWSTTTETWEQTGTTTTQRWVPDPVPSTLLNWDGAPVALNGVPFDGHLPYDGTYYYWYYGSTSFAHNVDIRAVNQVLGNPSWTNNGDYWSYGGPLFEDWYGHTNKLDWLKNSDWVTGSGASSYISTLYAPNTTSSLLEASRLAEIYLALQAGDAPPSATLSGYYMAYGQPHPYTIAFTKDAVMAKLQEVFTCGINTETPICLDLNHDGHIGVTGKSTAAVRKKGNGFVHKGSILFDLDGFGQKHRYEWLNGDGDGFLVYDKGDRVEKAMQHGGTVDGRVLFGNAIGYDNGFQKLAVLTSKSEVASKDLQGLPTKQANAATGAALKDLKVWINRHRDGRVHP